MRRPVALMLTALGAGCWPGWMQLFEQPSSQEHHVVDLRVLAVQAEPASIRVPPAVALGLEDAPVQLTLRPRIFDPRGGSFVLLTSACSKPSAFTVCTGDGMVLDQRTVAADADAPLGAVDLEIDVALSPSDVAQLFQEGGSAMAALVPVFVDLNFTVVREVNGLVEREVAVLTLEMRTDPTDARFDAEALAAVALVRCGSIDEDIPCGGMSRVGSCGDSVLQAGEACDPPTGLPPGEEVCSPECQDVSACPSRPSLLCAREVIANQRPQLIGLVRAPGTGVVVEDGTADIEPGDTLRVSTGERVTLAPVIRSADRERRPGFSPAFTGDEGPTALVGDPEEDVGFPPGCALPASLTCPVPEALQTRFYVGGAEIELVEPEGQPGIYAGNNDQAVRGVTVRAPSEPGVQPLVVVLADGNGGMDAAVFLLDVR